MITKAVIRGKIDNKFLVRIPLFENAGNLQEIILPATLCYEPGNLEGYEEGDVVYVGFENNEISSPVIIGKLYTGNEEKTKSFSFNDALRTLSSAELPKNTSIGEFTSEEVYATFKTQSSVQDRLAQLEQQMAALIGIVTGNTSDLTEIINDSQVDDEDIDDLFDDDPESHLNATTYSATNEVDLINLYNNPNETYDTSEVEAAVEGTNYGLVSNVDVDNLYENNNYNVEDLPGNVNPDSALNSTSYESTSDRDIAKLYVSGSDETFDNSELVQAVQGTDYGLVSNTDIDQMYEDDEDN